jgi:two-component system sensor histidine kinase DesK
MKEARREARHIGPPGGLALLPWLLMGMGSLSNLIHGQISNPVIGSIGLGAFNSLYVSVVVRAFHPVKRASPGTRWALVAMGLVTCGLALGYGGSWLLFFPLYGLAVGSVVRGRALGWTMSGITVVAGVVCWYRDGWSGIGLAYGTFISGMVTAAIMVLSETVKELRATREELARTAVDRERLRFSRDLHDLLGHTLSVIVVKAEAARRIAGRDIDAALDQVTDIESVGRQALTEIREAVTGYRQESLSTELDRARSLLTAAGVTPDIRRSGPPLTAQHEALLGWVVRETVTNTVRHSGAGRCEIAVEGGGERVRLTVRDDGDGGGGGNGGERGGRGTSAGSGGSSGSSGEGREGREGPGDGGSRRIGGTGLKGLTERLAAAGGSLTAGPAPRGGFLVTAELPSDGAPETVKGAGPEAGPDAGAVEGAPGRGAADGGAPGGTGAHEAVRMRRSAPAGS